MVEHNVILGGRQSGKTWRIMHEIHDLIVAGQVKDSIVVVFPSLDQAYFWVRTWHDLFGTMQPPIYVTINNRLKLRGRILARIYVENVEHYDDGIYDERLQELQIGLHSVLGDEEVIYTSGWLPLNQRSHSKTVKRSPQEIAEEWLNKKRRMKQLEDEMMVAHMLKYIEDSNAT